jgi:DNA-directed RNA polymerase specialized sigma24 family protein
LNNFYEIFYREERETLVSYGLRFDQNRDTAEDLVEDCHDMLCKNGKRVVLSAQEYFRWMITAMKNRYRDHYQHSQLQERLAHHRTFQSAVSPKPLMSLAEHACRSEEVELMMLAMARLSPLDREALLERIEGGKGGKSPFYQKTRAKKRLELQLIAVMAEQKHPQERPNCPFCFTPSLYFHLEALHWVCATCGQVTKVPSRKGSE